MSRMIHRSMKAYSISPNAASFVVKEMVDTYRMHLLPCASGQWCSAAHWATIIRSIMMMTVFGRATQMDGWRWQLLRHRILTFAAMPSTKAALPPLVLTFTVCSSTRMSANCPNRAKSFALLRILACAKIPAMEQKSSHEERLRSFFMRCWPRRLLLCRRLC